jgi:hypothetical protein
LDEDDEPRTSQNYAVHADIDLVFLFCGNQRIWLAIPGVLDSAYLVGEPVFCRGNLGLVQICNPIIVFHFPIVFGPLL